jgi:hypothetical protein
MSSDQPGQQEYEASETSQGESADLDSLRRRIDPDAAVWSETIRDLPAPESVQSIDFSWPAMWLTDCKLGGNNLRVFSDGTAHWSATVMSMGGGDAWLSTFEFFDNHGVSLWRFGRISSPSLSPPAAVIDWRSNNQLFFPAYLFPHVAQVNMRSHC